MIVRSHRWRDTLGKYCLMRLSFVSRMGHLYVSFDLAIGRESGESVSFQVSWDRGGLCCFRKAARGNKIGRVVLVIRDLCVELFFIRGKC